MNRTKEKSEQIIHKVLFYYDIKEEDRRTIQKGMRASYAGPISDIYDITQMEHLYDELSASFKSRIIDHRPDYVEIGKAS